MDYTVTANSVLLQIIVSHAREEQYIMVSVFQNALKVFILKKLISNMESQLDPHVKVG
jgi:hypothetical protein